MVQRIEVYVTDVTDVIDVTAVAAVAVGVVMLFQIPIRVLQQEQTLLVVVEGCNLLNGVLLVLLQHLVPSPVVVNTGGCTIDNK